MAGYYFSFSSTFVRGSLLIPPLQNGETLRGSVPRAGLDFSWKINSKYAVGICKGERMKFEWKSAEMSDDL